jgi:lipoate---protein ligase
LIRERSLAGGPPWRLLRERATASDLHAGSARLLEGTPVRTVRVCQPEDSALVLGSHQPASGFATEALAAAGLGLARRRSGGSAVLVGGERVLWVDFVIPKGDPLWDDDIGRAAWWVGDLWSAAIGAADVWRGRLIRSDWSPVVCFAGLGPGEVTVGGRKVVGVCQRRTGHGALFQTAALIEWRPEEYASVVSDPPADVGALADAATGLGASARGRVESALLDKLGH